MYPNIELAKLDNDELIYGTYEECEAYAEKKDTWVIRYFDHVNPSTVYNKFTYVGNDMYEENIKNYPGKCDRKISENFIINNATVIDYD